MTRRLLPLLVAFGLSAAPAAAESGLERYLGGEQGGTLSLANGSGTAAAVSSDGAIVGNVERGRVTIVNMRRGERTSVNVSGCERRRRVNARTLVCTGRDLTFSALNGRWRVTMAGIGINASARYVGTLTLVGRSGTFTLGDGPARRWPRRARTYTVG